MLKSGVLNNLIRYYDCYIFLGNLLWFQKYIIIGWQTIFCWTCGFWLREEWKKNNFQKYKHCFCHRCLITANQGTQPCFCFCNSKNTGGVYSYELLRGTKFFYIKTQLELLESMCLICSTLVRKLIKCSLKELLDCLIRKMH